MQVFRRRLRERQGRITRAAASERTWVYVPYDQLNERLGTLAEHDPDELGIVLVENPWKAGRRPYHRQKLAFVLGSQRQFALEQAERGVLVRYVAGPGGASAVPFRNLLRGVVEELGPLRVMRPAERELRHDLAPLLADGSLVERPHDGWLTTGADFRAGSNRRPPWRMDVFYRHVRKRLGVLMDGDGKPVGGKFSFDADNRERWRGVPASPEPPTFDVDDVLDEVVGLVSRDFGRHPGVLDPTDLPTRRGQVAALWTWAKQRCLPTFGPYEDAMSVESRSLFHTRISPLLNVCRLLPRDVVDDALALDLPLASQEGFVRQVLGWREFVRHVHEATDGLRTDLPAGVSAGSADDGPGDGNFGAWAAVRGDAQGEWRRTGSDLDGGGGATPSLLEAHAPLPPAYWGTTSGLACLDHVVEDVLGSGYSHHITRLMVLSNVATLLGVEPRQLTDWFWACYTDAYDWVVEPNVIGMGTFGVGELMTTKPYVSGAAYIDRMSDYCGGCSFHPKKNCPITRLYWAFLARNAQRLAGNHRMSLPLRNVHRRSTRERAIDETTFTHVHDTLQRGETLDPDRLSKAIGRTVDRT